MKLKQIIISIIILGIFIGTTVTAAYTTDDDTMNNTNQISYETQEIIIKFQKQYKEYQTGKTQFSAFDQLNEKHHVSAVTPLILSNQKNNIIDSDLDQFYKIVFQKEINIESIIKDYTSLPEIEYAQPNYIYFTQETIPNDPRFPEQWSLHQDNDCDIDAPELWDIQTGDENIIIAIHDTGVDYTHPDLADHIWTNTDETPGNGIDDDNNGYIDDIRGWDFVTAAPGDVYPGEDTGPADNDPSDFNGHGTHCAGIAAGITNNNIGIAGVSGCSIMPIRAGYSTTTGNGILQTEDIVPGIHYAADNGAHILSMSWGSDEYDQAIHDALQYAYSQGVILVTSAGNDESDEINYPAGYLITISIAATDQNDEKASFSSYGGWVDLSAPGVDILSTVPQGIGIETYLSINDISYESNHMLFSPEGDVTGDLMDAGYGRVEDVQTLDFTGKIALIERGYNSFQEKVINVYNKGAIGAVIFNNQPGNFNGDLQTLQNIPAVSITQADGQTVRTLLLSETLTAHLVVTQSSDYEKKSGTSMSCPMVAGIIGLLLSEHPDLHQEEVRNIICSTADPLNSDYDLGSGRINAHQVLLFNPNQMVKAPLLSPLALIGLMMVLTIIGAIKMKRRA